MLLRLVQIDRHIQAQHNITCGQTRQTRPGAAQQSACQAAFVQTRPEAAWAAAEQTFPGIAQAAVEDTCTGAAHAVCCRTETHRGRTDRHLGPELLLINKINK